jgi:hypothetical protein
MKNRPNCEKILNWIQDNAEILIVLLVCFGGYSITALLFGNNWLWPWATSTEEIKDEIYRMQIFRF